MSDEKTSIRERLLRAFGFSGAAAVVDDGPLELRIYLHVPREGHDDRQFVGTLTSTAGMWTFKYDARYADDPAKPPISAFPDKSRTYKSDRLWSFFDVRLPPLDREDVRAIVQEEGLEEEDKLRLLGFLSRRAVTSPFEFELAGDNA